MFIINEHLNNLLTTSSGKYKHVDMFRPKTPTSYIHSNLYACDNQCARDIKEVYNVNIDV